MTLKPVVVYRLGSLGDTVVSLPGFHAVMRAFPDARRILLTNVPVSAIAAPAESVLRDGGFVDEAIYYTVGERRPGKLLQLRRALKALNSDTLVYLTESRTLAAIWRDLLFFRLCGFKTIIGAPLWPSRVGRRSDPKTGLIEREAERLARALAQLGPIDLNNPANWDLRLTPAELEVGDRFLAPFGDTPFFAINTGGKVAAKDWGQDNWRTLIGRLAAQHPDHGLVAVGAREDHSRAEDLSRLWSGPFLSACGGFSPRETAAVLRRARLFIGHDSGPLHLAAAAGASCVSMFGAYNLPKVWHPMGEQHRIIHDLAGLDAITPERVLEAVSEALAHPTV